MIHAVPALRGQVEVIRGRCIGCGACVLLAPSLFHLDDQERAVLAHPPSPLLPEELARLGDALNGCPSGALRARADE